MDVKGGGKREEGRGKREEGRVAGRVESRAMRWLPYRKLIAWQRCFALAMEILE